MIRYIIHITLRAINNHTVTFRTVTGCHFLKICISVCVVFRLKRSKPSDPTTQSRIVSDSQNLLLISNATVDRHQQLKPHFLSGLFSPSPPKTKTPNCTSVAAAMGLGRFVSLCRSSQQRSVHSRKAPYTLRIWSSFIDVMKWTSSVDAPFLSFFPSPFLGFNRCQILQRNFW